MWLLILIILFISAYSILIIYLSGGIRQLHRIGSFTPSATIRVTLVIPFRNEAKNLPGLIRDLLNQSYPEELLHFIFVDDHSGDGSGSLLEEFTGRSSLFTSLQLPAGQSGKKKAIGMAVLHAKSEWIIQVDADCRLGPRFVSSHMAYRYAHPCDLLAGVVTTGRDSGRFIEYFERIEMLGLAGAGAGSFRRGWPVMCSGANLGYSRRLFLETRSFEPPGNLASGDDMFLMIAARKLGRSLHYILDPDSVVRTGPAGKWRVLVSQRVRWGSKSIHYGMADIQLVALLVALTNLSILLSPLLIFLLPSAWPWLALAFAGKSAADLLLLFRITGTTGQRRDLGWFLPASICYYPFHFVTLAAALFGQSRWKGRELQNR